MSKRWLAVLWLVLSLACVQVNAQDGARHFVPGSLAQIVAAHEQRPFILSFWSLTCTHCQEELALLAKLQRQYPTLKLVLVSTDTPEDNVAISATLSRMKLARVESWVFADSFAERLRFEVDRKWHGELPRTYFYQGGQISQAISGKLDAARTEQWVRQTSQRSGGGS